LYGIFDGLYERAAKMIAIAMTAVLKKSGASAEKPALIVAEGSTFRKGYRFQERFERWLTAGADGGPGKNGVRPYRLVLADDHTIVGAGASVFL